jgi:hypothetical protein
LLYRVVTLAHILIGARPITGQIADTGLYGALVEMDGAVRDQFQDVSVRVNSYRIGVVHCRRLRATPVIPNEIAYFDDFGIPPSFRIATLWFLIRQVQLPGLCQSAEDFCGTFSADRAHRSLPEWVCGTLERGGQIVNEVEATFSAELGRVLTAQALTGKRGKIRPQQPMTVDVYEHLTVLKKDSTPLKTIGTLQV